MIFTIAYVQVFVTQTQCLQWKWYKSIQKRKWTMRTYTTFCLKVNWNIQWFHIPKEIQISVIHSSSNTHSPVSLTVSPSLLLIHSLTLSTFHLSLNSHFWRSHQLLYPKVTAHTQYVHSMLHSAMESKIKRFSNFISQILQKHTPWETKSKYPNEFVRLQSFKPDSLSLLFLPLSDLWGVGVKL